MTIDLSGKNVLVTGASRGIGKAIAIGLASAGARTILHFNRNEVLAEAVAQEIGNDAFCVQANLADPAACESMFRAALDTAGRVDVLVNNAGIAISSPMHDTTKKWLEAWNQTMFVNLRSVELLTRLSVPHFIQKGGGRIINISSRAAFRGDTADYMAYAASKAGVVALTKSVARAFGKQNIAAFTIAPGFTRTDMAQDFMDTYGEDYALNDIALPRLTEPADIAPLVVLLASGLADHATGTSIDVNAGSYVH